MMGRSMYESLHPGDGMPVRQPEFSHRCECALVRQSVPQRNPGTGFSPALMRCDGVRLCLFRFLVLRVHAVSRFSESAVVHIAHSPAAQLCGAGGCSIKFPLQRSFSPADSRVKTADSPRQKICRGESRPSAPPPPCEIRFRRADETVYFSPRRTRDSSYCLRSRVPRMFSIILISPSFSA